MSLSLKGICNAVKSDPQADISDPKFCEGIIVTVTARSTGATITRWCENDDDAEVFVEAMSSSGLLGDKGYICNMTPVNGLRAVNVENYRGLTI